MRLVTDSGNKFPKPTSNVRVAATFGRRIARCCPKKPITVLARSAVKRITWSDGTIRFASAMRATSERPCPFQVRFRSRTCHANLHRQIQFRLIICHLAITDSCKRQTCIAAPIAPRTFVQQRVQAREIERENSLTRVNPAAAVRDDALDMLRSKSLIPRA